MVICMYWKVHVYVFVYMYVYVFTYIHIYMYVYMYVCICAGNCICMCMHINKVIYYIMRTCFIVMVISFSNKCIFRKETITNTF